jgi:hypothetical protein
MSTFKEIVYMCLDELQLSSDDATFTEDHIIFLANKYRALLLKKQYIDLAKTLPESNYQDVCLDLEVVNGVDGDDCSDKYLRSTKKIPDMLPIGTPSITGMDFMSGEITYVSRERIRYVGHNKFLKNIMYATLGPDDHLYIKSANPQSLYLERVRFSGVFEDPEKAAKLSCEEDASEETCDVLDKTFPLEDALIPLMIELVVKEVSNAIYRPADEENNASDDLTNNANPNGRRRVSQ